MNALVSLTLAVSLVAPPLTLLQSQGPRDLSSGVSERAHTHPVVVPFMSNGCSGFPDGRYWGCCFVHDLDYWAGGTMGDRRQADLRLRGCLRDVSGWELGADFFYMLVRLNIITGEIFSDGWGRAWGKHARRRYDPLTADQRREAAEQRARTCQSLTLDPQTGGYRVDEQHQIRLTQRNQVCDTSR